MEAIMMTQFIFHFSPQTKRQHLRFQATVAKITASEYVTQSSKVVEATTAGYEAAEALQNAIDYVNSDLKAGDFENGQKEYLTSNLGECRERLFDFLSYMPKDKLDEARKRVEEGELIL